MGRGLFRFFRQVKASARDTPLIIQRAHDLARADLTDEEAAAQLRAALAEHPDADRSLLEQVFADADTPEADRAGRLLTAALDDAPVEPTDPARAELFRRLDELESMPIGEAFKQLAAMAPGLTEIADTVEPYPAAESGVQEWRANQAWRLVNVVGPKSGSEDPVVATRSMERLATAYLNIAAGDTSNGTEATPFSEIKRKAPTSGIIVGSWP